MGSKFPFLDGTSVAQLVLFYRKTEAALDDDQLVAKVQEHVAASLAPPANAAQGARPPSTSPIVELPDGTRPGPPPKLTLPSIQGASEIQRAMQRSIESMEQMYPAGVKVAALVPLKGAATAELDTSFSSVSL